MDELNRVHNKNFLDNNLPDKCANLIIADPPYFEIKGAFDFIWQDMEAYLQDVRKWANECKRLLADNGTLFWYGHAKRIVYQQVILDEQFNLLNSLVWEKTECQTRKNEVAQLRAFAPVTERILMYDNGVDMSGLERIDNDPTLFMPIKEYFDNWLDKSGMTLKDAVATIGSSCTHWFGFSKREKTQFSFPTKDKWDKMESAFPNFREYEELRRDYEELRRDYEELRRDYEGLRLEYESLRRPFQLLEMTTDVLKFSQESHITKKYNHETKKPETLTRTMILTCTKKNDLVVVPFSGSGTECAMSAKDSRRFVGYDINVQHVETSNNRCREFLTQPNLF